LKRKQSRNATKVKPQPKYKGTRSRIATRVEADQKWKRNICGKEPRVDTQHATQAKQNIKAPNQQRSKTEAQQRQKRDKKESR
jgi:hypothetical protein